MGGWGQNCVAEVFGQGGNTTRAHVKQRTHDHDKGESEVQAAIASGHVLPTAVAMGALLNPTAPYSEHTADHFGRALAALRLGNCRAVEQLDQSRARAPQSGGDAMPWIMRDLCKNCTVAIDFDLSFVQAFFSSYA